MNANELANELKDCGQFFEDGLYLKAADELRRLQKENEMLKDQVRYLEKEQYK